MKESPWGPNPAWGHPKKNGHKNGQKKPDPRVAAHDGSEKPACMVVVVPIAAGIGLALWKLRRR